MPGSRRTRCAGPAGTSARSRRASRRSSSSRTTRAPEPPADPDRSVSEPPARCYCCPNGGTVLTQTAPTASDQPADDRLVGVTIPAIGPDGPLDGVALVTIHRPDVLNALSFDLLDALANAFAVLDADPACRAIVLTGSGERAFAAGADIRELARQTPVTLLVENRFAVWERIASTRKPVGAAVRGFALGGGCELAMSCDLIVAGEDARFGQPEINLGVMPGAGGNPPLARGAAPGP